MERVQSPADKTRARVSKRAGRAPRRLAKAVVFYRRVPASVILALRFKRKRGANSSMLLTLKANANAPWWVTAALVTASL